MNEIKNKFCCSVLATAFSILAGCGGDGGDAVSAPDNDGSGNFDSLPSPPHVGVLYSAFEGIPESRGDWVWGDSVNKLCHQWSNGGSNLYAWFYGTNVSWSSADIYVLKPTTDPLSVIAAENFDYTSGSLLAMVGDTVFFRGRNGFLALGQ